MKAEVAPPDAPAPGGGAALPFTGPGDMLAPSLLALLAMMGGSLLFMYASTREAAAATVRRSLHRISGFAIVHNAVERGDERAERSDT